MAVTGAALLSFSEPLIALHGRTSFRSQPRDEIALGAATALRGHEGGRRDETGTRVGNTTLTLSTRTRLPRTAAQAQRPWVTGRVSRWPAVSMPESAAAAHRRKMEAQRFHFPEVVSSYAQPARRANTGSVTAPFMISSSAAPGRDVQHDSIYLQSSRGQPQARPQERVARSSTTGTASPSARGSGRSPGRYRSHLHATHRGDDLERADGFLKYSEAADAEPADEYAWLHVTHCVSSSEYRIRVTNASPSSGPSAILTDVARGERVADTSDDSRRVPLAPQPGVSLRVRQRGRGAAAGDPARQRAADTMYEDVDSDDVVQRPAFSVITSKIDAATSHSTCATSSAPRLPPGVADAYAAHVRAVRKRFGTTFPDALSAGVDPVRFAEAIAQEIVEHAVDALHEELGSVIDEVASCLASARNG